MWFSISKWTWVKVTAKALLYTALIVATLFAIMYSFILKQHEDQKYEELQKCCDRCEMTADVKKCKKLQTDFYDLVEAHRRTWERHPVQALWDASGCGEVLKEWDKHNPCSSD